MFTHTRAHTLAHTSTRAQ